MFTDYRPLKKIPWTEFLDGRLQDFSMREDARAAISKATLMGIKGRVSALAVMAVFLTLVTSEVAISQTVNCALEFESQARKSLKKFDYVEACKWFLLSEAWCGKNSRFSYYGGVVQILEPDEVQNCRLRAKSWRPKGKGKCTRADSDHSGSYPAAAK